jgi:hypothetical protein
MLNLDVIRKLTGAPERTSDHTIAKLRDQLYLIARLAFEQSAANQDSKDSGDEQS